MHFEMLLHFMLQKAALEFAALEFAKRMLWYMHILHVAMEQYACGLSGDSICSLLCGVEFTRRTVLKGALADASCRL